MAQTGEYKPRRLKGTAAYSFNRYAALGCIGFGVAVTAVYELLFRHMRSFNEKHGVKVFERATEDSTQPVGFFPYRSPQEIKELLETNKDKVKDEKMSFSSQTNFVSQKTKNKLSLKNQSLPNAPLVSSKQNDTEDQTGEESVSRSFAIGSNLTTMEKYLEKFQSRKSSIGSNSNAKSGVSSINNEKSKRLKRSYGRLEKPSSINCTLGSIPTLQSTSSVEASLGKKTEAVCDENLNDCSINEFKDSLRNSAKEITVGNDVNQQKVNTVESNKLPEKTDGFNLLLCPLCWKSFECKDSQFSHMKTCAAKHKLSTKQLLDAMKLIQKQEAERHALGLPLLACKIPKKVKKDSLVTSIRPKNALEGSIQLGLALSASLEEAEKQKERHHLLEAGLIDEAEEKGLLLTSLVDEKESAVPAPIFLNAGKKGSDWGGNLPKPRKKNGKYGLGGRVPTLLKRTPEERERLITEKVGIILVGDETLNCMVPSGDKESVWVLQSEDLKKYLNEENILWTMAGLSPSTGSKDKYYVSSLSCFISPCKVLAGSKLKHLSQIPGRKESPVRSSSEQFCNDLLSEQCEGTPSKLSLYDSQEDNSISFSRKQIAKRNLYEENFKEFDQDISSSSEVLVKNSNSDQNQRNKPLEQGVHASFGNQVLKRDSRSKSLNHTENKELLKGNSFVECISTLSKHWSMFIGNSLMSDVTIYTQEDRKIPAHKLVLQVRCPSILNEVVEEQIRGGCSSSMLIWIETRYLAAFEFLRYIYTGVVSEEVKSNKAVLEDMNALAEKYYVKELLALLEKQPENSSMVDNSTDVINRGTSKCGILRNENLTKQSECLEHSVQQSEMELISIVKDNVDEDNNENDNVNSSLSPVVSDVKRNSPDIFQDTVINSPESVVIIEDKPENSIRCDDSFNDASEESRDSIEYLVSLMEKDTSSNKCLADDLEESKHNDSFNNEDNELSQTVVNSDVLENSLFFKPKEICDTYTQPSSPKTPSINNDTSDVYVNSTPAPRSMVDPKENYESIEENECKTPSDGKRKFTCSDGAEVTTPVPKKICVVKNVNPIDVEKEMVDLTLSGSETEEIAETAAVNLSEISTIPPMDQDLHVFSPASEKSISNSATMDLHEVSSMCNVWDDFDLIPEVPQGVLNESIIDKSKNPEMNEGKNEIISITSSDNSTKHDVNMDPIDKTSEKSWKMCDSPSSILSLDEEPEQNLPSPVKSPQSPPVKDFDITDRFLNASLQNIDCSVFWRDENEPIEQNENCDPSASCKTPIRTPLSRFHSRNVTPNCSKEENVTPLANYSAMKTPLLHKELDRYGIKHLRRNQAKLLLRQIYNELHPVVSVEEGASRDSSGTVREDKIEKVPVTNKNQSIENKVGNKKKITFESLDDPSSSEESSDSSDVSMILEESICEQPFESPVKELSQSQKEPLVDIPTAMKNLFESNPAFHRRVLLYEPIWLDEFKIALKEKGAKFNVKQLMDYLDEQCITFRLVNTRRLKKTSKKKNFSLSQPSSQRGRSKTTISNSQPF